MKRSLKLQKFWIQNLINDIGVAHSDTIFDGEVIVGGIDTVEVTQRFNAQCGVFNASLLSQTSSSNVVSLKLLGLRHSLITIYND